VIRTKLAIKKKEKKKKKKNIHVNAREERYTNYLLYL